MEKTTAEGQAGLSKSTMKSTWRKDRKQWKVYSHWLYEVLGIHPTHIDRKTPVHSKLDNVPFLADWPMQRWIIVHAFLPLILHQAYANLTGRNLGPFAAFLFYSVAFKAIAIHELHILRDLGQTYGFFDGDKHPRDEVPDASVGKVLAALISTSTFRPMMAVALTYRKNLTPTSIDFFWLPIEIGLYGVILDFWFYWYHRIMHDSDYLWKFHRTHHLTKHPNPLLTLYADREQEIFDIAVIPLLTWVTMKLMGLPMGFYEWWICYQYIVFTELFGHSGIRVFGSPPSTFTWLLRAFNVELVIEDHDLHHRKGWKKSCNYGKQTRLWDRVFGTCFDRIECQPENIDYENQVIMPLL